MTKVMYTICKNGVMKSVADGNKEYKIYHMYVCVYAYSNAKL